MSRLLEHNPWGTLVFFFVVVAGGLGISLGAISLAEYLGVVATAGGLLGIGHSVHRGAKRLSDSEHARVGGSKPS